MGTHHIVIVVNSGFSFSSAHNFKTKFPGNSLVSITPVHEEVIIGLKEVLSDKEESNGNILSFYLSKIRIAIATHANATKGLRRSPIRAAFQGRPFALQRLRKKICAGHTPFCFCP